MNENFGELNNSTEAGRLSPWEFLKRNYIAVPASAVAGVASFSLGGPIAGIAVTLVVYGFMKVGKRFTAEVVDDLVGGDDYQNRCDDKAARIKRQGA